MRVCHNISTVFDDPNLISHGGATPSNQPPTNKTRRIEAEAPFPFRGHST